MPAIAGDRERPFSAESYAAQYGITVEDAAEMLETSQRSSHPQMHRQILAMFMADPDLKHRALMLTDALPSFATPEEVADYERWMRDPGLQGTLQKPRLGAPKTKVDEGMEG